MSRAVMRVAMAAALGVLAAPTAAHGQRPTLADREITARLPKPENVTVQQAGDGAVVLSWSAVRGAKQYILGRSVGTNGFQRVSQPLVGVTRFIDRGVPVGTRVSYTITPVDSSDVAGLRATSADFIPKIASARPPTPVAAVEGSQIVVRWDGTPGRQYTVRYSRSHGTFGTAGEPDVGLAHELRLPAEPGAYTFAVISKATATENSAQSDFVYLRVPDAAAGGTNPSATGPAPTSGGGAATPAAPSEVSLTVASPVALRVGATTSATGPAGSQWLSLDAAIAGVSPEGLVTARAAGTARIVALTPQAAGAMRVTVVHVTVTP